MNTDLHRVDACSARPISQARILVVDDEPAARAAIVRVLDSLGYQAHEAASGSQALARLSALPYDLMLFDLCMPGIDGGEAMRQVQEGHPDLAVIVLTARATLGSAILAVQAGAADYVLMPCSIQDLKATISRALHRRRGRRRRQHLIHVFEETLAALRTG